MTQTLLDTDAAIRAEGDDILNRKGLRKLTEEYSPFHIVGSYTLQLMVWRDLDIVMDAPNITISQFFELGERITALLSPWKMFFTNNRDNEPRRYPKGLYWGIRLGDIKRGAWKIDLWAFDSDVCQEKVQECQKLASRINDENRLIILDIKTHVWNHPRYRDTMTSQDIYDAVLDHSVKSIDDFWKHMEKKE